MKFITEYKPKEIMEALKSGKTCVYFENGDDVISFVKYAQNERQRNKIVFKDLDHNLYYDKEQQLLIMKNNTRTDLNNVSSFSFNVGCIKNDICDKVYVVEINNDVIVVKCEVK